MTSPVNRWRFAVAVVALPVFDALLGYFAFPIVWWLGDHRPYRPVSAEQAAVGWGALSGILGLFVMITSAAPITVWMVRKRQTAAHHFAIAGLVLGNLPFAVYLGVVATMTAKHLVAGTMDAHWTPIGELLAGGLRAVLIGSVMGVMSGVLFWLIVRPQPASAVAH